MEPLLFFLAALFLLLPLPLCVFLLVKRSKDARRIHNLEQDLAYLTKKFYRDSHDAAPEPEATPATEPNAIRDPNPEEATVPPQAAAATAASPGDPSDFEIALEPSPEAPEAAPPPAAGRRLNPIAFLRTIGLWPPEDASTAEAGLMQWWLPRLGGLLATLAVISFAVYISQGTPPWVRFVELVIADGVVLGLGIRFLKKRPRFGANLLSTGLSMVYFTSIAAYAARPVRVIESPTLGILCQFAVIVGIFFASLKLANRNIAITALIYGFVSSLFSAYLGLLESSLISALALYIVGVFFSRRFQWTPILALSTVGAYLPILAFCGLKILDSSALVLPHSWSVLAFLMVTVSLLPLCESKWDLGKTLDSFRSLHILNTTLFLGFGYLYMRFFTNELVSFYGTGALVFALWASLFARRGLGDTLFQLFFLKASALAALWLVNRFAGDIRWFALIIEAALIAWVALRSKARLQEIASIALWGAAHWIAYRALGFEKQAIGSFAWFLFLSLPFIAAATLAALGKGLESTAFRKYGYRFLAVINGMAGLRFIASSDLASDTLPVAAALYGVLLCALCLIPWFSNALPAISGALIVLAANAMYWSSPYSEMSFAVVSSMAALLAWGIAQTRTGTVRMGPLLAELVFHAAWITSAYAYLANSFAQYAWFPFVPALFSVALLWTPTGPFKALRDASLAPLALFALLHADSQQLGGTGLLVAALLYFSALFLVNLKPRLMADFRFFRKRSVWRIAQHILVAYILIALALNNEPWMLRIIVLALSAVGFHLLWRGHKQGIALLLELAVLSIGFASIASIWSEDLASVFGLQAQPWGKETLMGGLLLSAVAIGLGIDAARTPHRRISRRQNQALISFMAILAFATYALTLSTDSLWNEPAFTPLTALFCLLLVGIGIGAKIKPYRLIALVGFALPLTRLFAYDIRDTLIRIVAFAVLAALFIFIGYLYHRFQSRIE